MWGEKLKKTLELASQHIQSPEAPAGRLIFVLSVVSTPAPGFDLFAFNPPPARPNSIILCVHCHSDWLHSAAYCYFMPSHECLLLHVPPREMILCSVSLCENV